MLKELTSQTGAIFCNMADCNYALHQFSNFPSFFQILLKNQRKKTLEKISKRGTRFETGLNKISA